jgi:hypothetical protein
MAAVLVLKWSQRTFQMVRETGVVPKALDGSKEWFCTLAAWRSGHRIRLRNEKTRVRISPGFR